MSEHLCHAVSCTTPVPPRLFMCRPHWFSLPKPMRDAIWATYRSGQEVTKDPSVEYLVAATIAIRWLAQKEGHR